jgi:Trypsin-like peptidase domain
MKTSLRRIRARRHPRVAGRWAAVGALCGGLCGAALLALGPGDAQAQAPSMRPYFVSVVRVECRLPDGSSLFSTGFAWREPDLVVTALHGAAGCASLSVYNETTTKRSPAKVQRAHLEADLALLKLERGLDMKPLQHLTTAPELNQDVYTVIGYPHGMRRLDTDEVRFSDGTQGWMTTLDVFDGMEGAKELFAGVLFPSKAATIFRVRSQLGPGQSGAPILDSKGRVVAIVDGGLRNSVIPLNWSMPAHKYLAALAESTNAPPTQPSRWTSHFSSRVEAEPKFVELPERQVAAGAAPEAVSLRRLRTMSLNDLEAHLRKKGRWKEDGGNLTFIRQTVKPQELASLTFDIYFDPVTGATFGVPTVSRLSWNAQRGVLESIIPSGKARMMISVRTVASYEQGKTAGKRAFADLVMPLATWQRSPATLELSNNDAYQYAQGANFFPGRDAQGQEVNVNLSFAASGKQVLGYAVYGPSDIGRDLGDFDRALYLMMQFGAFNLSGFAQQ